jgi:hypothetical protein
MVYPEYIYPYADVVGSTSNDTNITNPWENPVQSCPSTS